MEMQMLLKWREPFGAMHLSSHRTLPPLFIDGPTKKALSGLHCSCGLVKILRSDGLADEGWDVVWSVCLLTFRNSHVFILWRYKVRAVWVFDVGYASIWLALSSDWLQCLPPTGPLEWWNRVCHVTRNISWKFLGFWWGLLLISTPLGFYWPLFSSDGNALWSAAPVEWPLTLFLGSFGAFVQWRGCVRVTA